jgi:hypothetical protein
MKKCEEGRYSSGILNLGPRRRGVVSFTPLPLYRRGNSPRYPLYRGLGGPQSRSEPYGGEKNILPLSGNNPDCSVVQPLA